MWSQVTRQEWSRACDPISLAVDAPTTLALLTHHHHTFNSSIHKFNNSRHSRSTENPSSSSSAIAVEPVTQEIPSTGVAPIILVPQMLTAAPAAARHQQVVIEGLGDTSE